MRHLNIKQKKILRDWFSKNKNNIGFSFDVQKNLPYDIWEKLEKINDYETIYQDINRYIYDLVSEDINKVDKSYGKGGKSKRKKDTRNRCPICQTIIPDGWRTCKSCGDVLKGNPWLCVTDLM